MNLSTHGPQTIGHPYGEKKKIAPLLNTPKNHLYIVKILICEMQDYKMFRK